MNPSTTDRTEILKTCHTFWGYLKAKNFTEQRKLIVPTGHILIVRPDSKDSEGPDRFTSETFAAGMDRVEHVFTNVMPDGEPTEIINDDEVQIRILKARPSERLADKEATMATIHMPFTIHFVPGTEKGMWGWNMYTLIKTEGLNVDGLGERTNGGEGGWRICAITGWHQYLPREA